jgi:hypothetical protein
LLSHRSRSGFPRVSTLSGSFTFVFLAMVSPVVQ